MIACTQLAWVTFLLFLCLMGFFLSAELPKFRRNLVSWGRGGFVSCHSLSMGRLVFRQTLIFPCGWFSDLTYCLSVQLEPIPRVPDRVLVGLTGENQEAQLHPSGQAQIGVNNSNLNRVNSISTCKLEMEKYIFCGNKNCWESPKPSTHTASCWMQKSSVSSWKNKTTQKPKPKKHNKPAGLDVCMY